MELLNCEQKARSQGACHAIIISLLVGGCFSLATLGFFSFGVRPWQRTIVFGPIAAFALFRCISRIYAFVNNEVGRFGIRDDVIWWDSPRSPRSAGFIPLGDVCKVSIYEGSSKLRVTMRDGTIRRIPWSAPFAASRQLRAVLSEHYPSVDIEFVEYST